MALFFYQAVDASGTNIEGELEAEAESEVVASLQERGLYPVAVDERSRGRARRV